MACAQLLICCSAAERDDIRDSAKKRRQTISGYILLIMDRAIDLEERLLARAKWIPLARLEPMHALRPRTTFLVHCDPSEAARIRTAARRRQVTISGFVLHCLRRTWRAEKTFRASKTA